MSKIIVVPDEIFPRLITMVRAELARQRRVYDELDEENWPTEFDAHDIIMFEDVLGQLEAAQRRTGGAVTFPYWKGMELLRRLAQTDGEDGIAVVDQ